MTLLLFGWRCVSLALVPTHKKCDARTAADTPSCTAQVIERLGGQLELRRTVTSLNEFEDLTQHFQSNTQVFRGRILFNSQLRRGICAYFFVLELIRAFNTREEKDNGKGSKEGHQEGRPEEGPGEEEGREEALKGRKDQRSRLGTSGASPFKPIN